MIGLRNTQENVLYSRVQKHILPDLKKGGFAQGKPTFAVICRTRANVYVVIAGMTR